MTCHADGEGKGGLKLLGDGNEEAMHMFCASLTGSSFSLSLSVAGGGVCNGVVSDYAQKTKQRT